MCKYQYMATEYIIWLRLRCRFFRVYALFTQPGLSSLSCSSFSSACPSRALDATGHPGVILGF